MTCQKRREGDEWHCGACGTRWAVDDPEPPRCQVDDVRAVMKELRPYLCHKRPCMAGIDRRKPCSCGLAATVQQLTP